MGALAIITRLSDAIVATGAGLLPSSYRQPLEKEPLTGSDRRFEVRLIGGRIFRQFTGAGLAFLEVPAVVRVAYARPGGDLGTGDRHAVNIKAANDGTLIADALTDPRNWGRLTTDIRSVNLQVAADLVLNEKSREVWETRFVIQAEFPWLGQ